MLFVMLQESPLNGDFPYTRGKSSCKVHCNNSSVKFFLLLSIFSGIKTSAV